MKQKKRVKKKKWYSMHSNFNICAAAFADLDFFFQPTFLIKECICNLYIKKKIVCGKSFCDKIIM